MANCKSIDITGSLPFNYYDTNIHGGYGTVAEQMTRFIAFIVSPTSGLKIEWGKEVYEPNKHGGKTAMFDFRLNGVEAVSWGWLDEFKKTVKDLGGKINSETTRDIEA